MTRSPDENQQTVEPEERLTRMLGNLTLLLNAGRKSPLLRDAVIRLEEDTHTVFHELSEARQALIPFAEKWDRYAAAAESERERLAALATQASRTQEWKQLAEDMGEALREVSA